MKAFLSFSVFIIVAFALFVPSFGSFRRVLQTDDANNTTIKNTTVINTPESTDKSSSTSSDSKSSVLPAQINSTVKDVSNPNNTQGFSNAFPANENGTTANATNNTEQPKRALQDTETNVTNTTIINTTNSTEESPSATPIAGDKTTETALPAQTNATAKKVSDPNNTQGFSNAFPANENGTTSNATSTGREQNERNNSLDGLRIGLSMTIIALSVLSLLA